MRTKTRHSIRFGLRASVLLKQKPVGRSQKKKKKKSLKKKGKWERRGGTRGMSVGKRVKFRGAQNASRRSGETMNYQAGEKRRGLKKGGKERRATKNQEKKGH